ncbi:hypothetical protein D3C76_1457120 [compost metagenome]
MPGVIQQRGGVPLQHRIPALHQLEARQLLLRAFELAVHVLGKRSVALAGIAADDETGFFSRTDCRQLENIDALVLPGIGDFEIGFLNAVRGHSNRFPWT